MSEKILKIKYRCMHPSCLVYCKEGDLFLPESEFACLSSSHEGKTIFKSPRDACRMGFSQQFEALNISAAEDEDAETESLQPEKKIPVNDPVAFLIAEHKKVLEKLEKVEEMLVKRDIEGLWVATADLDNILHLHGGIKEEEILFPALNGIVPFVESLIICIEEDHREIVSLIHAFREALTDGAINDKVIGSALVALRSHIRKEDNEFFEWIKKYVDDEMGEALMIKMALAEKAFIPKDPGDRKLDEQKAAEREKFHTKTLAAKEIALDTCCH